MWDTVAVLVAVGLVLAFGAWRLWRLLRGKEPPRCACCADGGCDATRPEKGGGRGA